MADQRTSRRRRGDWIDRSTSYLTSILFMVHEEEVTWKKIWHHLKRCEKDIFFIYFFMIKDVKYALTFAFLWITTLGGGVRYFRRFDLIRFKFGIITDIRVFWFLSNEKNNIYLIFVLFIFRSRYLVNLRFFVVIGNTT